MITIYLNYIADYIERTTRAFAYHRLMSQIQNNMPEISEQEAMELMSKAIEFTTSYNQAWPWQRSKVVSDAIRISV